MPRDWLCIRGRHLRCDGVEVGERVGLCHLQHEKHTLFDALSITSSQLLSDITSHQITSVRGVVLYTENYFSWIIFERSELEQQLEFHRVSLVETHRNIYGLAPKCQDQNMTPDHVISRSRVVKIGQPALQSDRPLDFPLPGERWGVGY